LVETIALKTAANPDRPDYIEVKGAAQIGRSGNRPYVGTIPDFSSEEEGYSISGAASGSPADKGGMKAGDRIVKIGPHKVTGLDDFDVALRKFKAGDTVDFVVIRDKKEVTLKITLDPPR
jgi:S1-C subfamily serine protease